MAMESRLLADLVHTPPIKYFLSKIGEPVQEFTGNQASESGHVEEPGIINRFRYYDLANPDALQMYRNMKEKKRLNKVIQPHCYITNSKYPHLFASPDGLLYQNGKCVALVEAKLTNSFEAGTYENRVSPAFVLQCYQNMMLLELDTAYLVILVDGIYFEVITLKADHRVFAQIELTTARFWATVIEARMIKDSAGLETYYNTNTAFLTPEQMEAVVRLQALEPSIIGTDKELDFIKEICKPTVEYTEMLGTVEQELLCAEYLQTGKDIERITGVKQLKQIELIKSLGGTHVAKFERDGKEIKFTYKPNKNGVCSLRVDDKFLPEPAPYTPSEPWGGDLKSAKMGE